MTQEVSAKSAKNIFFQNRIESEIVTVVKTKTEVDVLKNDDKNEVEKRSS